MDFVKATLIRAIRTVCTSFVLTDVDWKVVVSASLLAGLLSVLTSVSTGLPEVEYGNHLYMNAEEPEDSEVEDEDE